jgi:hypothetical protein
VAVRNEDQRNVARIGISSVHAPIIVKTMFGILERCPR